MLAGAGVNESSSGGTDGNYDEGIMIVIVRVMIVIVIMIVMMIVMMIVKMM